MFFHSGFCPTIDTTVGVIPVEGVVEQRDCVVMKGLCGMIECMESAVIAVAMPWSRKGSMLSPSDIELVYFRTSSMSGLFIQCRRMLCAQEVSSFMFSH